MLLISYVTWVDIIPQVSLAISMTNIFIFRCADPETEDYYYYFGDRPTCNNSPDCPYDQTLRCLRLTEK